MNKSLIVKLRNYFSDRIEEIKDGSYVPTYGQIKELPEFSGIKREAFRIARKEWYSQHFRMSSARFSKRVENIKAGYTSDNKFAARLENTKVEYISEKEYVKKKIKEQGNYGYICIFCGVAIFVLLVTYLGRIPPFGGAYSIFWVTIVPTCIVLVGIGICLILYYWIKASKI